MAGRGRMGYAGGGIQHQRGRARCSARRRCRVNTVDEIAARQHARRITATSLPPPPEATVRAPGRKRPAQAQQGMTAAERQRAGLGEELGGRRRPERRDAGKDAGCGPPGEERLAHRVAASKEPARPMRMTWWSRRGGDGVIERQPAPNDEPAAATRSPRRCHSPASPFRLKLSPPSRA